MKSGRRRIGSSMLSGLSIVAGRCRTAEISGTAEVFRPAEEAGRAEVFRPAEEAGPAKIYRPAEVCGPAEKAGLKKASKAARRFGITKASAILAWILSGTLALGDVLTVAAEEHPTFGQLISGETAQGRPESESQYTVIDISTEEELLQLAKDCQLDSWSRDKYVTLACDIDLKEARDVMIPSFGGIFDGGGHTVSGLTLTAAGSAVGLFRYIQDGAVVRNLSVAGTVAPAGSKSQVGILAGSNYGMILDCSVSGSVTGTTEVGGIAGVNEAEGEIRRCRSAAAVTGDHFTGGICGSNKGTLNNCENTGNVNTHSVEVSHDIEDITLDGLENINSAENVAVHMDTGGVSGYSEGKIYYCVNSGTVGYQHVGYNVGGIVGRVHQGYLQNCTNTGHVLGRKDVGGIAGQLEPFLEIAYLNDKLGELDRETGIFFDLLETAHEDISSCGQEASALAESVSTHLTNASAAGGNLTGTANELWYIYNQELTGINNDLSRLNQEWANQAAADRDKINAGTDSAPLNPASEEQPGERHKTVSVNPGSLRETESVAADTGNPGSIEPLSENSEDGGNTGGTGTPGENGGGSGDAGTPGEDGGNTGGTGTPDEGAGDSGDTGTPDEGAGDSGGTGTPGEGAGDSGDTGTPGEGAGDSGDTGTPGEGTGDSGDTGTPGEDSGNSGDAGLPGGTPDDWDDILKPGESWGDNRKPGTVTDFESYLAALRRFGEGTSAHLGNITSATNDRSGGITDNLRILNQELEAAGNDLRRLAEVLQQSGDTVSADVDAMIAQGKTVRRCINELRDDLFRYEGISVEDASDEAAGGDPAMLGAEAAETEAYYDTSTFQQGKITLCINQGPVEADANVGGITGLIATEFDFDPEDDITISGEESFRIEQSVKAVVRESRNLGEVTGKKDYAGGIVGKADFGAIVSCESYGDVSSLGGNYVGGIAGSSDYCVRSCYTMGAMTGESYVGGIVGRGCDIFYSYAYPELCYSGECAGSVAGSLREEGTLYGNYYVQGKVPGVDSIGYESGAMPLSYEEFCGMDGVPDAFVEFTVSFLAEGQELASFQCRYGDSIDKSLIPQVPEKEGYYGAWPQFDYSCVTGNKVLEARYEKWVTSLASQETDEDGKALILVQGEFLPETELKLEQGQDGGTKLTILLKDENGESAGEYSGPIIVRAFCEDAESAAVEILTESGYQPTSGSAMGSYLEFAMEQPGTFRLTAAEGEDGIIIIVVGAGICAAILAIILIRKIRKSRKRRKTSVSSK
ncbi:MAG: hypothetical protein HFH92_03850 [Lachnospiraceae bacterium]|uniref:hypothetical protein n=1 Tax=uncultured Acetatifactor sp. TaxID=1671927 RepID=UPI0026081C5A|nr:hypothetical protein [uncultured Acetatifactor sp.]MCI8788238.1 hypothetical protein [Lachnospiraceae bacterium]